MQNQIRLGFDTLKDLKYGFSATLPAVLVE
jgi:hypothetical protein